MKKGYSAVTVVGLVGAYLIADSHVGYTDQFLNQQFILEENKTKTCAMRYPHFFPDIGFGIFRGHTTVTYSNPKDTQMTNVIIRRHSYEPYFLSPFLYNTITISMGLENSPSKEVSIRYNEYAISLETKLQSLEEEKTINAMVQKALAKTKHFKEGVCDALFGNSI